MALSLLPDCPYMSCPYKESLLYMHCKLAIDSFFMQSHIYVQGSNGKLQQLRHWMSGLLRLPVRAGAKKSAAISKSHIDSLVDRNTGLRLNNTMQ